MCPLVHEGFVELEKQKTRTWTDLLLDSPSADRSYRTDVLKRTVFYLFTMFTLTQPSVCTGLVLGFWLSLLRTSSGSAWNVPARRRTKNTRRRNTNHTETMQQLNSLFQTVLTEAIADRTLLYNSDRKSKSGLTLAFGRLVWIMSAFMQCELVRTVRITKRWGSAQQRENMTSLIRSELSRVTTQRREQRPRRSVLSPNYDGPEPRFSAAPSKPSRRPGVYKSVNTNSRQVHYVLRILDLFDPLSHVAF